jgi:hypothetical protein
MFQSAATATPHRRPLIASRIENARAGALAFPHSLITYGFKSPLWRCGRVDSVITVSGILEFLHACSSNLRLRVASE